MFTSLLMLVSLRDILMSSFAKMRQIDQSVQHLHVGRRNQSTPYWWACISHPHTHPRYLIEKYRSWCYKIKRQDISIRHLMSFLVVLFWSRTRLSSMISIDGIIPGIPFLGIASSCEILLHFVNDLRSCSFLSFFKATSWEYACRMLILAKIYCTSH